MSKTFTKREHEQWLRAQRLLDRQAKAAARRKIKSLAGQASLYPLPQKASH